jgi:hypothetical protein
MKPPAQLKSLDDLMAQAGHYAEFCFRNSGRMAPTCFLLCADGPMMFMPETMINEQDKDNFANTARLICIAHAATACVMALEAWMKMAKPGETLDVTELPSEAIDRLEVVTLMGEDRNRQRQRILRIVRSDNGKFFSLAEAEFPVADQMTGRFAQILPPTIPDQEMQMLAKAMLKVKGVRPIRLGNSRRFRK